MISLLSTLFRVIVACTLTLLVIGLIPGLPPDFKFEPFSVKFGALDGAFKINDKLNGAERLFENEIKGPEDLAVFNNELYTTTHGGFVQKITKDGKLVPVAKFGKMCDGIWQEESCGRPLGMKIDSIGNMYVADAYYGVKSINLTTGVVKHLVNMDDLIDGVRPSLPNSVAVSKKGTLYWSDSSTTQKLHNGVIMLLGNGDGRILQHNPRTEENKVLLKDLHFPNGMVLSNDESFLIVSETFKARLIRLYLTGEKAGKMDIFIDNLPGFPDNINILPNGNFIVSLILPENKLFEYVANYPFVRKVTARTLMALQSLINGINSVYQHKYLEKFAHWIGHFEMMKVIEMPSRVTLVMMNQKGSVLGCLHSTDNRISHISSVTVFNDYYYLGSPFNAYLARVKI